MLSLCQSDKRKQGLNPDLSSKLNKLNHNKHLHKVVAVAEATSAELVAVVVTVRAQATIPAVSTVAKVMAADAHLAAVLPTPINKQF